jgi:hypothetical protein
MGLPADALADDCDAPDDVELDAVALDDCDEADEVALDDCGGLDDVALADVELWADDPPHADRPSGAVAASSAAVASHRPG